MVFEFDTYEEAESLLTYCVNCNKPKRFDIVKVQGLWGIKYSLRRCTNDPCSTHCACVPPMIKIQLGHEDHVGMVSARENR